MAAAENPASADVDDRTERALTEYMPVLPAGGDIYTVVGQNGSTYRVDGRDGRCTCPDHKHREVRCKHIRRVAFATGQRPIPVAVDGVDEWLGEHTEGEVERVATDGGVIDAGDEGKVIDENDDGHPDECDCVDWHSDVDLPCWPCYRAGFVT